ncbi:MAG: hypothetical protein ACK5S6_02640 [bacterium]|jgi:hypothetical protein
MAFGSGKKPANQGSMGKVNTQPVKKSGTPSPAKPGASKMLFSNKPSGTKGSGKGTK